MREVSPVRQLRAPTDRALVVFVRPSTEAKSVPAHVVDEQRQYLGSVPAGGHFSVVRNPGPQRFYVYADDEDVVAADLGPGLVYFIEVTPQMGGVKPRFSFRAARRGSDLFPYKAAWVDDTTQYRVDFKSAREAMAGEAAAMARVVKNGEERLEAYQGAEKADHVLAATDGHTSPGVPGRPPRFVAPAVAMQPAQTVPAPVGRPPPRPPATQPQAGPQQPPGFIPEEFPSVAPPGPPPEVKPEAPTVVGDLPRGYPRGSTIRINLKNGQSFTGEVKNETRVDLKIVNSTGTHLFDFEEIASIDRL